MSIDIYWVMDMKCLHGGHNSLYDREKYEVMNVNDNTHVVGQVFVFLKHVIGVGKCLFFSNTSSEWECGLRSKHMDSETHGLRNTKTPNHKDSESQRLRNASTMSMSLQGGIYSALKVIISNNPFSFFYPIPKVASLGSSA